MYYLKIKHVNLLRFISIFMILSPNTDTLKLAHNEINLRRSKLHDTQSYNLQIWMIKNDENSLKSATFYNEWQTFQILYARLTL